MLFGHEAFLRVYLNVAEQVYNRSIIDCLCFIEVN